MVILNPWQWYCSTRTFSNSLETTLTIMALYYWPWPILGGSKEKAAGILRGGSSTRSKLRVSLLLAAVAVVLRPTNLFIWLAILTLTLTRMTLDGPSPLDREALVVLFGDIALCGSSVLAVSATSDRLYFGFWTFPAYKWLHFNLSHGLAVFYGRNDWHYYLSQGVPLLTTTVLPFALIGLYKSTAASVSSPADVLQSNTLRTLSFAVLTTVGTLSLISHKEVRFIYPLLPILLILAAPHVVSFFTAPRPPVSSASTSPSQRRIVHAGILSVLLLVNVVLASYLSLFHQPAPLSVLTFLRTEYERLNIDHLHISQHEQPPPSSPSSLTGLAANVDNGRSGSGVGDELFALFLMPCHSTPWRSYLVYPSLRARALTCEPPLNTLPGTKERAEYLDEADRFYASRTAADGSVSWGVDFLLDEMWPLLGEGHARGGEVPRYIVGFEGIESMLLNFLDEETGPGKDMRIKLRRVWESSNGLFNEDWRRRGQLVVWDTGIYPGAAPKQAN